MKKTIFCVGLAAVMLAVGSASALSAAPYGRVCDPVNGVCSFVDANGDGICDHAQAGNRPYAGRRQGAGAGRGYGRHGCRNGI